MCVQFTREELEAFAAVKRAFDPGECLNPARSSRRCRCAEGGKMHVRKGFAAVPRAGALLSGRSPLRPKV